MRADEQTETIPLISSPTASTIAAPSSESVAETERAEPSRVKVRLTNRQKVAVLLAQLGTQRAAPILKEMSEEEAVGFIREIMALPQLKPAEVHSILSEFLERLSRAELINQGGHRLAREFLQEKLGQARAQELMEQIEGQHAASPLTDLLLVDPQQVLAMLSAQQPQVVAVILAYLPPADAAGLLSALDPDFRIKVAKRIAQLTRVDPAAIRQATSLLVGKLRSSQASGSTTIAGGTTAMAEILNHSDRSIEHQVLAGIEEGDRDLAERIRAKLFTFDDVLKLDDKALQQIFRKVDAPTLALAMKEPTLSQASIEKIRKNLSARVLEMIDEETEVMGAVRSAQVNVAQSTIVGIARQLDAEGVIIIAAREGEVVL